MARVDIPLKALPTPKIHEIKSGVVLLPLSRRGIGLGMIVAEKGYTVIEIRKSALDHGYIINQAIEAVTRHENCSPKHTIGLVAYGHQLWEKVQSIPGINKVPAAAIYPVAADAAKLTSSIIPTVQHLHGPTNVSLQRTANIMQHNYPMIQTDLFAPPTSAEFDYATEAVSHTRTLSFLKRHMNGPYFDLEAIWEEHTYFELDNQSVEHAMNTMVQEPYFSHIPTMTGGIGRDQLTRFYRGHFIFSNPHGTNNHLISWTIGIDRVVDEFIMTLTHDSEIDWLIPGIPPTGLYLEIPFVAAVNIQGDRLYDEHIAWDQATVLRQLGLIPEYLPYPYLFPDGKGPAPGRAFEFRVPAAGAETAAKMRDKNAAPSNQLFAGGVREV
ncbi:LEA domain protein [Aspergillus nomiae NRRL 13137]|uniref:LEA domain protein n=1 Tax=Aspergillus nomiae NRRL (strain ATCC 15546 / NRRL 13137 / CBS 260.88 / M93) TaxID=1509407 RepID=A0A0L1J3G4_ASPN3|nr:LEA domain protein [Aspergillus nomiae NRRL 13137]KNG86351.1 LEA domain protein [Aspergillus nomiae NRRL 13137]